MEDNVANTRFFLYLPTISGLMSLLGLAVRIFLDYQSSYFIGSLGPILFFGGAIISLFSSSLVLLLLSVKRTFNLNYLISVVWLLYGIAILGVPLLMMQLWPKSF